MVKEKLLAYLRSLTDRDAVGIVCGCGGHSKSINELIDEVERDTEEGRTMVELFAQTEALGAAVADQMAAPTRLDGFLTIIMRKVILVPLAFFSTLGIGLVMFPDNPVGVVLSAAIAGAAFLFPKIPPEDMHIKP